MTFREPTLHAFNCSVVVALQTNKTHDVAPLGLENCPFVIVLDKHWSLMGLTILGDPAVVLMQLLLLLLLWLSCCCCDAAVRIFTLCSCCCGATVVAVVVARLLLVFGSVVVVIACMGQVVSRLEQRSFGGCYSSLESSKSLVPRRCLPPSPALRLRLTARCAVPGRCRPSCQRNNPEDLRIEVDFMPGRLQEPMLPLQ